MKKNLDQYLVRFLRNDGSLYIDNKDYEENMYRFNMIGKNIYLTTNNSNVECGLGTFERVSDIQYRINYLYDVYCLIDSLPSRKSFISVIQKLHEEGDTKGRLLDYLISIHDKN